MGHFITTAKFDKTEPNDIAGLLNQLAPGRASTKLFEAAGRHQN